MPGLVTFGPQCSLCLNNAAAVLITRTPIQRTVNTVQPCTLEVSEPGALCSPVVFGSRPFETNLKRKQCYRLPNSVDVCIVHSLKNFMKHYNVHLNSLVYKSYLIEFLEKIKLTFILLQNLAKRSRVVIKKKATTLTFNMKKYFKGF